MDIFNDPTRVEELKQISKDIFGDADRLSELKKFAEEEDAKEEAIIAALSEINKSAHWKRAMSESKKTDSWTG